MSSKGQFEKGHEVPVSTNQDSIPGKQHKMEGPEPISDHLPTADGGAELYKASGKLQGKKALITGGDSGIGRSIAILYAMEGAESVIVYLSEEEKDAQETKRLVEQKGGKVTLISADLREAKKCKEVVDQAVKTMGRVNILVLNHGSQLMQETIADLSEEQWIDTFNTNIHPFFFLSKYVLPQMKRGDTIITCASVNPYIGRPDLLDYTSTKGAIVAFTRALSNQQIGNGIRVNAVCPGPIWTPLIPATMSKDAQSQFTSPMGRPGQPSEVATCFVFLAGPDSSFISARACTQTVVPKLGHRRQHTVVDDRIPAPAFVEKMAKEGLLMNREADGIDGSNQRYKELKQKQNVTKNASKGKRYESE